MRNYSGKMKKYWIPTHRYRNLKELCVNHKEDPRIDAALKKTTDEVIAEYIRRQVTESCSMAALEADGMPCNRDTFRVYRAKFFWVLNEITMKRGDPHTSIL